MDELTIGAVAKRAGLRPSAVRYYESVGLLPLPRRVSGQRRYTAEALRQLAFINLAQRAGLTIAEIKALRHDYPQDALPIERWQAIAPRKIRELDELIKRVNEMRETLEGTLRCTCVTLEDCGSMAEQACLSDNDR